MTSRNTICCRDKPVKGYSSESGLRIYLITFGSHFLAILEMEAGCCWHESSRRKQMMKLERNSFDSMDFDRLRYATGIISTREAMIQVLDELDAIDFPMQSVSVFFVNTKPEKSEQNADVDQRPITLIEGSKAGAITGGATGGLLALAAGLGAMVIPGVGPVLAVESVLATLLASGASATVGSLMGAFHGWFAPEKQARFYDSSPHPTEFLMKIEGRVDQIQLAEAILRYWQVRDWCVYQQLDSTST
ncbi:MAG TPA: hypothetical protein V6D19_24995 [Stenomitos sp.]